MKISGYLTTGEFARMMGVTKDTLFHYDRIGLFHPAWSDENGYRYYSLDQVETFDVIFTLKDLGMPLAEIQEFMENRTPQILMDLFKREEQLMNERIRSWKKRRDWLVKKQAFLAQMLPVDTEKIEVFSYPKQYYISRHVHGTDDRQWIAAAGALLDYCEQKNIRSVYGLGYRLDTECGEYDTVYSLLSKFPSKLPCEEKEAGNYLTVYHTGDWRMIEKTYERMRQYAGEQGLALDRYCYEDTVIDGLITKQIEEYVTRITCRVRDGLS